MEAKRIAINSKKIWKRDSSECFPSSGEDDDSLQDDVDSDLCFSSSDEEVCNLETLPPNPVRVNILEASQEGSTAATSAIGHHQEAQEMSTSTSSPSNKSPDKTPCKETKKKTKSYDPGFLNPRTCNDPLFVMKTLNTDPIRTRSSAVSTGTWQMGYPSLEGLWTYLSLYSQKKPLVEGPVWKDVQNKKALAVFRKRYFVLHMGLLIYYGDKLDYERDKKNGLKKAHVVVLDGLHLSKPDSETAHGAKFSFILHVPHKNNKRKQMLLAVRNRKSKNIWLELLQMQNLNLQPSRSEEEAHYKQLPYYIQKIRDEVRNPVSVRHQKYKPANLRQIRDLSRSKSEAEASKADYSSSSSTSSVRTPVITRTVSSPVFEYTPNDRVLLTNGGDSVERMDRDGSRVLQSDVIKETIKETDDSLMSEKDKDSSRLSEKEKHGPPLSKEDSSKVDADSSETSTTGL